MKLLVILFLTTSYHSLAECRKEIKVQTTEKKLNIDSLKKDENKKIYKEKIFISCKLYNEIDVGDILKSEENERSIQNKGFLFFPEIIRKTYKILEK